jgi:hypothetical protein
MLRLTNATPQKDIEDTLVLVNPSHIATVAKEMMKVNEVLGKRGAFVEDQGTGLSLPANLKEIAVTRISMALGTAMYVKESVEDVLYAIKNEGRLVEGSEVWTPYCERQKSTDWPKPVYEKKNHPNIIGTH